MRCLRKRVARVLATTLSLFRNPQPNNQLFPSQTYHFPCAPLSERIVLKRADGSETPAFYRVWCSEKHRDKDKTSLSSKPPEDVIPPSSSEEEEEDEEENKKEKKAGSPQVFFHFLGFSLLSYFFPYFFLIFLFVYALYGRQFTNPSFPPPFFRCRRKNSFNRKSPSPPLPIQPWTRPSAMTTMSTSPWTALWTRRPILALLLSPGLR